MRIAVEYCLSHRLGPGEWLGMGFVDQRWGDGTLWGWGPRDEWRGGKMSVDVERGSYLGL